MQTVRFEFDHPSLGNYGVTLPVYRWGYTEGNEYFHRSPNTTADGRHARVYLDAGRRHIKVVFREIDTRLDALRNFSVLVHRHVRDVRFYPNYSDEPNSYWVVDWAPTLDFNRITDNYQEVEVDLVERGRRGQAPDFLRRRGLRRQKGAGV